MYDVQVWKVCHPPKPTGLCLHARLYEYLSFFFSLPSLCADMLRANSEHTGLLSHMRPEQNGKRSTVARAPVPTCLLGISWEERQTTQVT